MSPMLPESLRESGGQCHLDPMADRRLTPLRSDLSRARIQDGLRPRVATGGPRDPTPYSFMYPAALAKLVSAGRHVQRPHTIVGSADCAVMGNQS